MIVAIDGPAGVGKSTVARLLASRLGFLYLDTGALYRAVAWAVLNHKTEPLDGEAVAKLGVVGPTRMDYPGTMGAVRAVARYVGQILAES